MEPTRADGYNAYRKDVCGERLGRSMRAGALVVMALWRLELEGLLPSYTPYGVAKSTDPADPEYTYY